MHSDNQQLNIHTLSDQQSFINTFDQILNKYLEEVEEEIRTAVEKMINDLRLLTYQWKNQSYYQLDLQPQQLQSQMDTMFKQIKQNGHQMINRLQSIVEYYNQNQNRTITKQIDNIQYITQLKQSPNLVCIKYSNKLDQYKNQIIQYQNNNQHYQIVINFWYSYSTTLDCRMKTIQMIDQLNANHKVAKIMIEIDSYRPITHQVIQKMIQNYYNVYEIYIGDSLDSVQTTIHNSIKQLLSQSTILVFKLLFYGGLKNHPDGLTLLKEYNHLIAQKKYLQWLSYDHAKIWKTSSSKETIQQIIDEVNNM